jgi:hypothetical protein
MGLRTATVTLEVALSVELVVYLAFIAAAVTFSGPLEWRARLILPGVIAVYHVAYGLGFLIGVMTPAGGGLRTSTRLFHSPDTIESLAHPQGVLL